MPKIRGVKPEYWTDEDIVELSIPARLLFIGLWNFACDNGHLDDKPKQIKMRIFPSDDVDVEELLQELVNQDRIERADGTITIPKFAHHQRPHKRWWATCDLPGCNRPKADTSTSDNGGDPPSNKPSLQVNNGSATVAQPLSNGRPTADGDVDVDGDGDGDRERAPRKRATRLPENWTPNSDVHDDMLARFPHVDHNTELEKFRDYWQAKSGKDATKVDWDATWRNWIRRAAERGGNVRQLPQRPSETGYYEPPQPGDWMNPL